MISSPSLSPLSSAFQLLTAGRRGWNPTMKMHFASDDNGFVSVRLDIWKKLRWNEIFACISLTSSQIHILWQISSAECKWVNWKCSSPSAVTSYKWYPNCPSAFIWRLLVPVPVSAAQTNKMQLFVQCITYLKRGVWNEEFSFCCSSYRKLSMKVGRKERVCCNVVL